jgi:hypothetical protein
VRALMVTVMLLLPFAARAADELGECLASCDEIEKLCNEKCAKKAKGGAATCKPQCKTVADACKADCKTQSGAK